MVHSSKKFLVILSKKSLPIYFRDFRGEISGDSPLSSVCEFTEFIEENSSKKTERDLD